jgi:hypothetical protein
LTWNGIGSFGGMNGGTLAACSYMPHRFRSSIDSPTSAPFVAAEPLPSYYLSSAFNAKIHSPSPHLKGKGRESLRPQVALDIFHPV